MNAQAKRRTSRSQPGHRMTIINWVTTRSTGDILVILIASVVSMMVLGAGAAVFLLSLIHPETDTSQVVGAISDIINTLIGLLAGFLAGRTDATQTALKAQAEAQAQSESIAHTKARALANGQTAPE